MRSRSNKSAFLVPKEKAHDCNHELFNSTQPAKVKEKLLVTDYIIAISGLIKMTSSLPIGMLIFLLISVLLCILAWKSPELIKAIWKDKDDD